jgi:hypothetical protein
LVLDQQLTSELSPDSRVSIDSNMQYYSEFVLHFALRSLHLRVSFRAKMVRTTEVRR